MKIMQIMKIIKKIYIDGEIPIYTHMDGFEPILIDTIIFGHFNNPKSIGYSKNKKDWLFVTTSEEKRISSNTQLLYGKLRKSYSMLLDERQKTLTDTEIKILKLIEKLLKIN